MGPTLFFCMCGNPVVSVPFVEEIVLSPLNGLGSPVKGQSIPLVYIYP